MNRKVMGRKCSGGKILENCGYGIGLIKMAYSHSRKYSDRTIKLLFSSQGRCAFPGCANPLVHPGNDLDDPVVSVQIAHIYSVTSEGPRPFPGEPTESFINSYENLLLLCGYHHPIVDGQASTYSVEELRNWKAGINSNIYGGRLAAPEFEEVGGINIIKFDADIIQIDEPQKSIEKSSTASGREVYRHVMYQCYWYVGYNGGEGNFVLRDFYPPVAKIGNRVSVLCADSEKNGKMLIGYIYNHHNCDCIKVMNLRSLSECTMSKGQMLGASGLAAIILALSVGGDLGLIPFSIFARGELAFNSVFVAVVPLVLSQLAWLLRMWRIRKALVAAKVRVGW